MWRKKVVYLLQPKNHQRYLDIGAGTGDLAREIIQKAPRAQVVAADLTLAMIMYGREKKKQRDILWVVADAQALPFSENTFAGIVSGYLLRNVPDINRALCEQNRVLQNEARLVSLDTTRQIGTCFTVYPDLSKMDNSAYWEDYRRRCPGLYVFTRIYQESPDSRSVGRQISRFRAGIGPI